MRWNLILYVVSLSLICVWSADGVYRRFKKEYKTVEELKKRFATFVDSVKLVERHNKEKHSYTLAVNGR